MSDFALNLNAEALSSKGAGEREIEKDRSYGFCVRSQYIVQRLVLPPQFYSFLQRKSWSLFFCKAGFPTFFFPLSREPQKQNRVHV